MATVAGRRLLSVAVASGRQSHPSHSCAMATAAFSLRGGGTHAPTAVGGQSNAPPGTSQRKHNPEHFKDKFVTIKIASASTQSFPTANNLDLVGHGAHWSHIT